MWGTSSEAEAERVVLRSWETSENHGRRYPLPVRLRGSGRLMSSPSRVLAPWKRFHRNLISVDRLCWQRMTANYASPFHPEKWGYRYPSYPVNCAYEGQHLLRLGCQLLRPCCFGSSVCTPWTRVVRAVWWNWAVLTGFGEGISVLSDDTAASQNTHPFARRRKFAVTLNFVGRKPE